ncbi:unnamed protein product [Cuscuta campestris]|uniref:Retrotransposon Copia-like N-terminal domain-containing protein n=1 Tax=Cuscuta campestris TaxID=132261 RepID=A0A484MEF3_9ASTE|nr:unnamed protein product [Cuscuta campestris]
MSADKTPSSSTSVTTNPPHLAFTTVSNVKLQVPVLLSFSEPNYKKWSRLFLLLVRRSNLEGFLTGTTVPSSKDDVEWIQLDALNQGWILSTITDEVSDLIISSTTSSADLWKAIHQLFHDNKAARAMQLEHKFFSTTKGSASITAYCQNLRNIADWLDDVDAPVTENQLVLQVLRGLPEDLSARASFLQFQKPPPTFLETRSALLLLEQQRQTTGDLTDHSTALAAIGHRGGGPRAGQPYQHGGGVSPHGNGQGGSSGGREGHFSGGGGYRGGRTNRGRGRGRGRNSGVNYRLPYSSFGSWQIPTYSIGPAQPTVVFNPNSPHTQTPTALTHQFDTLTLREPTWFMDTGASHHIASDPGSSDGSRDLSVQ